MIFHQPGNSMGNYNFNATIYTVQGYDSHFHSNYELMYVLRGSLTPKLNGVEIPLEEGQALLISPFMVHSFPTPIDSQIWIGVFSEDYVPAFGEKHRHTQFSAFRFDEEQDAYLRNVLFHKEQPEHYLCIACLYMVCSGCLKNAAALNAGSNRKFVNHVISYLSENLDSDISLKVLSDSMGYEYHYCSSLFHQCFAMDFKKFLNQLRFEKACKFLRTGQKDIAEICRECGFSSIRNFNRVFRQFGGMTPSEYQKA